MSWTSPGSSSPAARRKPRSKPTLCPTIGSPPQKARSSSITVRAAGSPATSESPMPVSPRISSGMGRPGSTRLSNASARPERSKRVAPTSMMRSVAASNPVVSRSMATKTGPAPALRDVRAAGAGGRTLRARGFHALCGLDAPGLEAHEPAASGAVHRVEAVGRGAPRATPRDRRRGVRSRSRSSRCRCRSARRSRRCPARRARAPPPPRSSSRAACCRRWRSRWRRRA